MSIRQRLLVWVLSALSLGGAGLLLVAYFNLLHELNEVHEDSLKQVALAVAEHGHPGTPARPRSALPPLPSAFEEAGDFDYLTLTWAPDGRLRSASDPSVQLPFVGRSGSSRQRAADGQTWYVYTLVLDDRVVQAAQRSTVRRLLAGSSAAYLLGPLLLLIALIGALIVLALRRGLAPLDRAAASVAARSAASLAPITVEGLPQEIHPLVHAIDELIARLAEAFSAQRQFVADAAHELRSPVTALRLQLQLLERSPQGPGRETALAELKAGVERAQRLIEQLLQLSRVGPEAPPPRSEPVDLGAMAREVVGALAVKADHLGVDLGADTPPHGPAVPADGDQLRILLTNLVENALRHAPAGHGLIDVRAGRIEGLPAWQVVDNGPGIPPAERERVFDRFYRGEGGVGAQGSGLGLAIVRAIAYRHAAQVRLLDAPGGGLEVRVTFRR